MQTARFERRRTPSTALRIVGLLALVSASAARAEFYCRARWGAGDLGGGDEVGTIAAEIPVVGFGDGGNVVGVTSAAAHADYLSLGTAASFYIESQFPLAIAGADAAAIAESRDVVTPHGLAAGTAGFLVYDLNVSGSNVGILSPTHAGDVITHGGASVATQLTVFTCAGADVVAPTGSAPGCSDGIPAVPPLELNLVSYANLPAQLSIPVLYETPVGVYFLMISGAGLGFDPAVAETFDGATSFADTITVMAVELRDADGNPVPGASLTAASGTVYPVASASSTTSTVVTTSTSITTTTFGDVDACTAIAGIPRARCRLETALTEGLCADPTPPAALGPLAGKLTAADTALGRALTAGANKRSRLLHAARNRLAAASARAAKAVTAKRPAKRITEACATTIGALVTQVDGDF